MERYETIKAMAEKIRQLEEAEANAAELRIEIDSMMKQPEPEPVKKQARKPRKPASGWTVEGRRLDRSWSELSNLLWVIFESKGQFPPSSHSKEIRRWNAWALKHMQLGWHGVCRKVLHEHGVDTSQGNFKIGRTYVDLG